MPINKRVRWEKATTVENVPKPKKRTHGERRTDSDRRIINAAIELIAHKGYQKTTLIQIGKKAGCTGTLISNRFGSKEGLLRTVLANILSRFVTDSDKQQVQVEKMQTALRQPTGHLSKTESSAQPSPKNKVSAEKELRDFIRLYLEDVVAQQSRIRALHVLMGEALGALPEIRDEVIKVNVLFRARVAAYIRTGIENGEFRTACNADHMAFLIVGLLRGVTTQTLMEGTDIDLLSQTNDVQEMALARLKR